MGEETLDLVEGSETWFAGRGSGHLGRRPRLEQFVADDLHRHRQVKGGIFRAGRNRQVHLATLQFFVRQAAGFAAEEDGDGFVGVFRREAFRHSPGVGERDRDAPASGAGADRKYAVADGFVDAVDHLCLGQNIYGAGSAPVRLRVREPRGAHQVEGREAHRLHRPGGGADISGMAGFDQHDANVGHGLLRSPVACAKGAASGEAGRSVPRDCAAHHTGSAGRRTAGRSKLE